MQEKNTFTIQIMLPSPLPTTTSNSGDFFSAMSCVGIDSIRAAHGHISPRPFARALETFNFAAMFLFTAAH